MKKQFVFIILAVFTLNLVVSVAETNPVPLKRLAFIVGSNAGYKNRVQLKYAVRDANAFADVLTNIGGVEQQDILLLQDPCKTEFLNAIGKVREMTGKGAGIDRRKELLFYYSGHADEYGLLLGNEQVSYDDLRSSINKMPVDVRIVILDACSSGGFTREKGGTQRPPFLYDASSEMKGHAFLTSSSFDEAAQESDRLKGSLFTCNLIAGLRGAADVNSDGKVTLNESYQYAFNETLKKTEGTYYGSQHPAYDIRLKGRGDLVLTDLRASTAGLRFPVQMSGIVSVRDTSGNLLVELNKVNGQPMEVGLEPGTYIIMVDMASRVLSKKVILVKDNFVNVNQDEMDNVKREVYAIRGDLKADTSFQPSKDSVHYRVLPAMISFLPSGISKREKTISCFSIGVIGDYTTILRGLDISSGFSIVQDNMTGVQISGGGNLNNGEVNGLQISGGINTAGSSLNGIQITGGMNTVQSGGFKGLQISSGLNFVQKKAIGIMITGGLNINTVLQGIQISGGGNVNKGAIDGVLISGGCNLNNGKVNGLQISGVINTAGSSLNGIQITGGMNTIQSGGLKGLQISSCLNFAKRNATGVQITGGANIISGLKGLQIAGGANNTSKSASGLQIAGLFNTSEGTVKGLQIAGGFNSAKKVKGVQIAGGCNIAGKSNGIQIGIVNIAHESKGAQVGIINISDKNTGVPIGVLSFVKNNPPHFQVWTDESGYLYAGIRSGSKRAYSLCGVGGRMGNSPWGWASTVGLGFRSYKEYSYFAFELMTTHMNENAAWDSKINLISKARIIGGINFSDHFSIWAGPSINYYGSEHECNYKFAYWKPVRFKSNHYRFSIWPGFAAGIEL